MGIWKPVSEFPRYVISWYGEIKNIQTGKILKQQPDKDGYLFICLTKNRKRRSIHRLVAKAFIPNPFDKKEINHKDFNKSNNIVPNLEWVTRTENRRHWAKGKRNIICRICKKHSYHIGLGLCSKCYHKQYQQKNKDKINKYQQKRYKKSKERG